MADAVVTARSKNSKMLAKSRVMSKRMGERTTEVRPVGAWVQPELIQDDEQYFAAVVSARVEEERILTHHQSKQEKLQRFQADVKKRVKAVEDARKKQQIEKSYRAMEAERNILHQTMQASEKVMARKDRCCLRKDDSMKIASTVRQPVPEGIHNQKKQVHQVITRARKTLLSKKIIHNDEDKKLSELPGGPWRVSPTRDHPAQRNHELPGVESLGNETLPETYDRQVIVDNQVKKVHFTDDEKPIRKKKQRKEKSELKEVDVNINVPELYPGVLGEQLKRQTSTQRALYRRLFMDIEREQVKEMKKRQCHRKRIQSLKKSKENERKRVEIRANYTIEPRDPVTGETAHEMLQTDEESNKRDENDLNVTRKQIENNRFVEALKISLRERIEKQGLEIPPLCNCAGDSIWDTDPSTCANNCFFYRNQRGYTKALQSLLSSLQG